MATPKNMTARNPIIGARATPRPDAIVPVIALTPMDNGISLSECVNAAKPCGYNCPIRNAGTAGIAKARQSLTGLAKPTIPINSFTRKLGVDSIVPFALRIVAAV